MVAAAAAACCSRAAGKRVCMWACSLPSDARRVRAAGAGAAAAFAAGCCRVASVCAWTWVFPFHSSAGAGAPADCCLPAPGLVSRRCCIGSGATGAAIGAAAGAATGDLSTCSSSGRICVCATRRPALDPISHSLSREDQPLVRSRSHASDHRPRPACACWPAGEATVGPCPAAVAAAAAAAAAAGSVPLALRAIREAGDPDALCGSAEVPERLTSNVGLNDINAKARAFPISPEPSALAPAARSARPRCGPCPACFP